MSRRRQAEVRVLEPDLVYGDVIVTAFINRIMREG
ncbi:MAG: 30S ribosomal protein S7, partial [Meiothermus sp.]